jgi:hypothetical protein
LNGRAQREEAAMRTQPKTTVGRRQFFRAVSGVAAAAAVPLAPEALADSESDDDKRKARYRESEEVKTYYRVNRYPS